MIRYSERYWNDVGEVAGEIPGIEKIYNRSVFITGATGMICSAVAEILLWLNKTANAGIRIYLAGRDKTRVKNRFYCFDEGRDYYFTFFDAAEGGILDLQADYMIHGAGNADPGSMSRQPVETMLANIVGLDRLLSAAVRGSTKRLLYISSSEVYGKKANAEPYRENDYGYVDILNPRACYPCSKRAAETLCAAYAKEFGLDTVTVRPGHIYGPSITDTDDRASAQFTRAAAAGQDIVMKSAGQQLRSYCYTLDCASGILAVLLNGEVGTAYNISNRDSVVTIRDVAEAFAEAAGVKVVYSDPSDAEKRSYNLMDNSALDARRLELLGWRGRFDLKRGVGKTMEMLK